MCISSEEMCRNLLGLIATSEKEERQAAAEGLQKLETEEGFGIHLCKMILDTDCPLPVRQLASETLKNYIGAHWCSTDPNFLGPEINSKNKTRMKELLFEGLPEPIAKIREKVADILSIIISWDWPDKWPELFQILMAYLNKTSKFAVLGGMQVLHRFVLQVNHTTMEDIGSIILQEMNRIFGDENQYSVETRAQAIDIFTDVVSKILRCKQPESIISYLHPEILVFCEKLTLSWTSKDLLNTSNHLKIVMLRGIQILMETLSKCLVDFFSQILPFIWKSLVDNAEVYHSNADFRDESTNEGFSQIVPVANNSDDFVMVLLDFIGHWISGKFWYQSYASEYNLLEYEWYYLQDSFVAPHAPLSLITLLEITDKQVLTWDNDINKFVEEEELKSNTSDIIRGRVEHLLITIVDYPERAIMSGLFVVVMNYLEAEIGLRELGSSAEMQKGWKSHEAFLFAFCLIKKIVISRKTAGSLLFDVKFLLKIVVLADIVNPGSHPLLVGRCLCLGGLYADQMSLKLTNRFLEETINCLQERQPPCLKICAAKAVYMWYCRNNFVQRNQDFEKILRSKIPAFFHGLDNLARNHKSAEVLALVLKSIASLESFDKAFAFSVVDRIYSLAVSALFEYRLKNSNFHPWVNVFKELTLNPQCIKTLQRRLVPTLVDMMSDDPQNERRNDNIALEIVQCLVENSPQSPSQLLIGSLFSVSCKCTVNAHDRWTSDRGVQVIHTFLQMAPQEIINFQDNVGKTGPEYILQAVVWSLNHESNVLRVVAACELAILLIKKTGSMLRPDINELLETVHGKLSNMSKWNFDRRALFMVYAHLINALPNKVLKFLLKAAPVKGHSAAVFVIREGFCKEYNLFDVEDRKTITLALTSVLNHGTTDSFSDLLRIF